MGCLAKDRIFGQQGQRLGRLENSPMSQVGGSCVEHRGRSQGEIGRWDGG